MMSACGPPWPPRCANWNASRHAWPEAVAAFDQLVGADPAGPGAWFRTPGLLRLASALVAIDGEPSVLGRFRLSISADADAFNREKLRLTAMKVTDPWSRLAAAYHLVGDQRSLDTLLGQQPAAAAGIGDLYAGDQEWERAIAEYRKAMTHQTADGSLAAKLAAASGLSAARAKHRRWRPVEIAMQVVRERPVDCTGRDRPGGDFGGISRGI